MSEQRFSKGSISTIIALILLAIVALPDSLKTWMPEFLRPSVRLGLDLAGGTQLDFRISEDEILKRKEDITADIKKLKDEGKSADEIGRKQVELRSIEDQHTTIVEAIRSVLERRMNSLGVSEVTITPSYFGNEKHLLVECPGVIDVNQCIATVGKTIRLEFKEEQGADDGSYAKQMRTLADTVYRSLTTGTGSMQVYGQDLSSRLGVSYTDSRSLFLSDLPKGLEMLRNRTSKDPVVRAETSVQTAVEDAQGNQTLKEVKGIYLVKVLEDKSSFPRPLMSASLAYPELAKTNPGSTHEVKTSVAIGEAPALLQPALQTTAIGTQKAVSLGTKTALVYVAGRVDGAEEMQASHILIQYKGAQRADATVLRSKEEAKAKIQDIEKRLQSGADFSTIARTESDGPSKGKSGALGTIRRGLMVPAFEEVAFAMKKGEVSEVVETPFGFHIIRADSAATLGPSTVSYEVLTLPKTFAEAEELIQKVEKGGITKMDEQIVVQGLFFSLDPTGWKDTPLNGQRFRSASVTTDPQTNVPVVQILFDEEGGKLFQELTKRNIGKRIAIFVGGELVSAPNVQAEIAGGSAVITGSRTFEEARTLAQDLNTGAIPAPIYLSGQSTIEPTLGASALSQSVFAAAVGLAVLCFFMIIIYRLLGVIASIALLLYVMILVAAMKLPILLISNQHVVLTLAGIAGMILSMGMAVDANVLAFERVKEELRKGKAFRTAVETGFKKAWPSVRDGNFSTLITCAILFMIGTSIIRGFSITLSMGIIISLFTAVVVSRWLCRVLSGSPLSTRSELFGVSQSETEVPLVK